jgi:hypothetical protein
MRRLPPEGAYGFSADPDSPDIRSGSAAAGTSPEAWGPLFRLGPWTRPASIRFANRVTTAPQLDAPRFRWVPYDDALLFPLDNSVGKADSPDRVLRSRERLLKSYLTAAGTTSG